jgi:hypothetical protein
MAMTMKRQSELICMLSATQGDKTPYIVTDDGEIKVVSEIEKVTKKFENPNILEVQCFEEETAEYFRNIESPSYDVAKSSDGSYWVTDYSRMWD